MSNKARYIYFIGGVVMSAALFVVFSPEHEAWVALLNAANVAVQIADKEGYLRAYEEYSHTSYAIDPINRINIRCNSTGGVILDSLDFISTHVPFDQDLPPFRCDYDNSDRRL